MNQDSATTQSRIAWMLGGAALGAVAMFLVDPDRGRRRRALATDKIRSAVSRTGGAVDVASRDLGNRVQGLRAQASRVFARDKSAADDRILMERVRQKIGRAVSHPHAIGVVAQQGRIILSGPVLAHEKEQLLETVSGVSGVGEIEDNLDAHERADGISSLQGSGRLAASAARDSWTPALRAVALIGGGVLGLTGLTRRTPASPLLITAGAALMMRSISNMPFGSMAGLRRGRQAIELHKTIHIEAPPDTVFGLWSNYENFPRFMSHVQEVRDLGNGRSHWVVRGPAGVPVEWDAEITEARRPEVLAWRSEPGSTVQHGGTIRFEPDGSGTRVNVHMFYTPPAGMVGHAVASLFNADPKRQMDDDLMRMKAFVETGHPPHDAARPGLPTAEILH